MERNYNHCVPTGILKSAPSRYGSAEMAFLGCIEFLDFLDLNHDPIENIEFYQKMTNFQNGMAEQNHLINLSKKSSC
jgi:hypothetical protein